MKRLAMTAASVLLGTGLSWAASSDDNFASALAQGASSVKAAAPQQGNIPPDVANLLSRLQAGGAGALQARQAPQIDKGMNTAELNGQIKGLYDKGSSPEPEQLLGIREGSCEDTKSVVLLGALDSMADPITGKQRRFVKAAMLEKDYFEAVAQHYFEQMRQKADEHKQYLPQPGEREYMMLASEIVSSMPRATVKFTQTGAMVQPLEGLVDAELRETPKGLAASLSHMGFSPSRYYCFFPSGE